MFECTDVGEALVGEGCAIPAFGRGLSTELGMEAVVVVVGREARERSSSFPERREQLTVEQLGPEYAPYALDLAVDPRRAGLRADVSDVGLREPPADNVSTPGIQTTKGLLLSPISSSGMPQESKQSCSRSRIGYVLGGGSAATRSTGQCSGTWRSNGFPLPVCCLG